MEMDLEFNYTWTIQVKLRRYERWPFVGKLVAWVGKKYMCFYTSKYKSDDVTENKPIKWIWSKQSVNKKYKSHYTIYC
jgi:hypothetical protein